MESSHLGDLRLYLSSHIKFDYWLILRKSKETQSKAKS